MKDLDAARLRQLAATITHTLDQQLLKAPGPTEALTAVLG